MKTSPQLGVGNVTGTRKSSDTQWLDLGACAEVTVLAGGRRVPGRVGSWSAPCPGEQLIEIRFHHPTSVSRLRVVSSESEQSRTQEITVWVSSHRGERHRELWRRQFSFDPSGATEDVEERAVELVGVSAIHVRLVPSIDGHSAVIRVSDLRVAAA